MWVIHPSIAFVVISACLGPEAFLEIFCVPGFGVGLLHFSIDPMPLPFLGLFMFYTWCLMPGKSQSFARTYAINPATVSRNAILK